jgi:hypothetical protein
MHLYRSKTDNMKIFNIRQFYLVFLVLTLGILSSCEKDEDNGTDEVQLLSFGPSGVKHGEQISVIGKNLDKVLAIKISNDSIPQSAFVSQTSELIVITVPETVERSYVTLVTQTENIISKTVLDLNVPVKIESITTEARPGDNITIKGQYLNWIKQVKFSKELIVSSNDFVSSSLTELVVKVPVEAQTGTLEFTTGGTEPATIVSENDLLVSLPSISEITPNPVARGSNLTIKGQNLDLTKGVLFKGITNPITEFVSKSANELVVKVPEEANKGVITLVAFSSVKVDSKDIMTIEGDLPSLDPVDYTFFKDEFSDPWQDWGWGCTRDLKNAENVRDGNIAIKVSPEGGWGALSIGNGSVSTAGYSHVTFSVYGGPGTQDKELKVVANWGKEYMAKIVEGQWTEFKVPLSDLGSPADITTLTFQDTGWSGFYYIDFIGLRK